MFVVFFYGLAACCSSSSFFGRRDACGLDMLLFFFVDGVVLFPCQSLDALLFVLVCGITDYGQNSLSMSRSLDVPVSFLVLEFMDNILFLQCLECLVLSFCSFS